VIISSSGRMSELLEVADKARERGAYIIAITASQSPLARKADAALIVDHVEDISTHLPMISRILHLLVIDILAVGVAMQRNPENERGLNAEQAELLDEANHSVRKMSPKNEASASISGYGPANPLARLTSHSR
jgi:glucokinase